jgi:SAM-dependent methyltransferase
MTAPLRLYGAALRRADAGRSAVLTLVSPPGQIVAHLDAAQWTGHLRPGDESMLRRCHGATLDVGCGPGRLAAALYERGRPALGIDISAEAVRQAHRRGALAMRGDIFGPLPMEGRWRSILLADGNIGIGGDPGRLLRRCARLLDRRGAVIVELQPPGAPSWAGEVALCDGDRRSTPFGWARVAARDAAQLPSHTPLRLADEWTEAGRWFVHLVQRAR